MKLNNLRHLKNLDILPSIKPLQRIKTTNLLNEMELILYSTNLCLFSARILRDEIQIQNRNEVLSMVNDEINKLYNILSKKDISLHNNYSKKDTKDFFKKVKLKPKHIKN